MSWVQLLFSVALAQEPAAVAEAPATAPKWYEALRVRGYTQFRYDDLPTFAENPALVNSQGDRYIGDGVGFGIRRARLVLQGDAGSTCSSTSQGSCRTATTCRRCATGTSTCP